jgi:hypothetical protein
MRSSPNRFRRRCPTAASWSSARRSPHGVRHLARVVRVDVDVRSHDHGSKNVEDHRARGMSVTSICQLPVHRIRSPLPHGLRLSNAQRGYPLPSLCDARERRPVHCSRQNCQSVGGSGKSEPGLQPSGGDHPSGGVGQLGGTAKTSRARRRRHLRRSSSPPAVERAKHAMATSIAINRKRPRSEPWPGPGSLGAPPRTSATRPTRPTTRHKTKEPA